MNKINHAAAERPATTAHHHHDHDHAHCDFCGDTFGEDDADELTAASNAIVDSVHDGKLFEDAFHRLIQKLDPPVLN